jgi:hypothetical protein
MKDTYKIIRKIIKEQVSELFDEERISNPDAAEYVDKKQNFVGSHTYGENIGELDKMYVAYSYGEQHPLYVWMDKEEFKKLRPKEAVELNIDEGYMEDEKIEMFNEEINVDHENFEIEDKKGPWFLNQEPYYVQDKKGKVKPNKWTKKHSKDLRPNEKVQARDTSYLKKLISDFKRKYKIKGNEHTNLKPGEK